MSKIDINNEIVLMRQAVRKARVVIIRKLSREAKLLQARKHGDEKTKEKCSRKGLRLVAEMEAMKKIKDDDISKFCIANTRKLQDVLADAACEPATRVMTRLASQKILVDRIAEFKKKFPEYEQHLGPGRKKKAQLQRQANREIRNAMKRNPGIDADTAKAMPNETEDPNNINIGENVMEHSEESGKEEEQDDIEESDGGSESVGNNSEANADQSDSADSIADNLETDPAASEIRDDDETNDEIDESSTPEDILEPGSILRIKTPISTAKKRKKEDTEVNDSKLEPKNSESKDDSKKFKKMKSAGTETKKITKQSIPKMNVPLQPKKPKSIKVISREASVKRFTDFTDETQPEEIVHEADVTAKSTKRDMKIEKEVDSFFMTENGESEYMSVVVPRSKICDDDEQDDRFGQNHAAMRQKNFHERNNKFFSKIDQRGSSNSHSENYGPSSGRQRSNNFSNSRGPPEKFGRFANNGNARSSRPETEKKIEAKEENLHPSWAARKKQQEILKQGFQGKKIVFAD